MHAPAKPAERDKKLRRDNLDSIGRGVCQFALLFVRLNMVPGRVRLTALAAGPAREIQNALNPPAMHELCAGRDWQELRCAPSSAAPESVAGR
jgi:hypothetical protein